MDLGAEGDRLEHFLQFLQYMYTGGCRLDGANCMPLLRLSNFYEVCMPQQYRPYTQMCPAPCALAFSRVWQNQTFSSLGMRLAKLSFGMDTVVSSISGALACGRRLWLSQLTSEPTRGRPC